jgi:hypothetical protein
MIRGAVLELLKKGANVHATDGERAMPLHHGLSGRK